MSSFVSFASLTMIIITAMMIVIGGDCSDHHKGNYIWKFKNLFSKISEKKAANLWKQLREYKQNISQKWDEIERIISQIEERQNLKQFREIYVKKYPKVKPFDMLVSEYNNLSEKAKKTVGRRGNRNAGDFVEEHQPLPLDNSIYLDRKNELTKFENEIDKYRASAQCANLINRHETELYEQKHLPEYYAILWTKFRKEKIEPLQKSYPDKKITFEKEKLEKDFIEIQNENKNATQLSRQIVEMINANDIIAANEMADQFEKLHNSSKRRFDYLVECIQLFNKEYGPLIESSSQDKHKNTVTATIANNNNNNNKKNNHFMVSWILKQTQKTETESRAKEIDPNCTNSTANDRDMTTTEQWSTKSRSSSLNKIWCANFFQNINWTIKRNEILILAAIAILVVKWLSSFLNGTKMFGSENRNAATTASDPNSLLQMFKSNIAIIVIVYACLAIVFFYCLRRFAGKTKNKINNKTKNNNNKFKDKKCAVVAVAGPVTEPDARKKMQTKMQKPNVKIKSVDDAGAGGAGGSDKKMIKEFSNETILETEKYSYTSTSMINDRRSTLSLPLGIPRQSNFFTDLQKASDQKETIEKKESLTPPKEKEKEKEKEKMPTKKSKIIESKLQQQQPKKKSEKQKESYSGKASQIQYSPSPATSDSPGISSISSPVKATLCPFGKCDLVQSIAVDHQKGKNLT